MNKRFAARLSRLTDLPTLQTFKGLVPLASLKRQPVSYTHLTLPTSDLV